MSAGSEARSVARFMGSSVGVGVAGRKRRLQQTTERDKQCILDAHARAHVGVFMVLTKRWARLAVDRRAWYRAGIPSSVHFYSGNGYHRAI